MSKTLKYYKPQNKSPKLVRTTHYQTHTLKALQVLIDPETPLTPTNVIPQVKTPKA